MAPLARRVSGLHVGIRQERSFPDDRAGRAAAKAFAATLDEPRTVFDVRTRIAGRVVTRTFRRRREAEAYASTVENERLRGLAVDPRRSRTPLDEVARQWLNTRTAKRASSITRDRAIVRHHISPALGARPIGAVTRAEVQAVVDRWSQRLAASRVARQFSCLRAIYTLAESAEIVARNPCRGARLPQVRLVDRRHLDADELEHLATALGGDQATMMWVGAVLGLRWGEAVGLTLSRVDVDHSSVVVDRQLARNGELEPPKSAAGVRRLACPDWLTEELRRLVFKRAAAGTDALLFVNGRGGPLDYTNWRERTWLPACAAVGLSGLRFHDLRSLAATALVTAGVDIKTAQVRLGHSSPQVTLGIYARATLDADRRAADAVGALLRPRDGRAMGAQETQHAPDPSGLNSGFRLWAVDTRIRTSMTCENG